MQNALYRRRQTRGNTRTRRYQAQARNLWCQQRRISAQEEQRWIVRALTLMQQRVPISSSSPLRWAFHRQMQAMAPDDIHRLLQDRRANVRHSIIAALCCHTDHVPIALLWHALTDLDERFAIALLLADVPETFPLAELRDLLATDPDDHIRLCALAALGQLGDACPIEALCQGVQDRDPLVRRLAEDIITEQWDCLPALMR